MYTKHFKLVHDCDIQNVTNCKKDVTILHVAYTYLYNNNNNDHNKYNISTNYLYYTASYHLNVTYVSTYHYAWHLLHRLHIIYKILGVHVILIEDEVFAGVVCGGG